MNIIEFINSCIDECDLDIETFKRVGFIQLSKVAETHWSFLVCFKEKEEVMVGGHYPILASTVRDISDVLSFIDDSGIEIVVKKGSRNTTAN